MPLSYPIAPWIKAAQGAQMYARGFPMGLEIAQAAARIQEAQARSAAAAQRAQVELTLQQQRQQQQALVEQQKLEVLKAYHDQQNALDQQQLAQAEEKIQQAARVAAQRSQAMQSYRQAIAGGMDPLQAILQWGPEMGQQASAEAAAIRAMNMRKPITPEDVRAQNVLDPETGMPIEGVFAVPSASGMGMAVRNRPVARTGQLTPSQKATLLARIPEMMGISGVDTNQLAQMVPVLQSDIAKGLGITNAPTAAPAKPPQESEGLLSMLGRKLGLSKEPASSKLPGTEPITPQLGLPGKGAVLGGYRFLGGDPADENSWELIQPEPSEELTTEQLQAEDALLPGED